MCPQLISDYQAKMKAANDSTARLRAARMELAKNYSSANFAQVERSLASYAQAKRAAEAAETALVDNHCTYTKIIFTPL